MTMLGSVLTVMAAVFFGTLVAGSQVCARVDINERQAMGLEGPKEAY